MTDFADLEAAAARIPRPPVEDMLAAWRQDAAAPPPPPSLIPAPEYPYGLRSARAGTARFSCPLGCGWYHEENPGAEQPGPIRLPAEFTPDDLSAAITAQANARGEEMHARVEEAITAHYAEAHPGR